MSPALIILMLVCAWLAVSLAMLWGMLRLARRNSAQHSESPRKAVPAALMQQREIQTERKTAPRWGLFSQLARRG